MLGSLLVERVISRELRARPEIVDAFTQNGRLNLYATPAVPPGGSVPAMIFYQPTTSTYDGFVDLQGPDDINSETLNFDVIGFVAGLSHVPIHAAVKAQMSALSGREFDETDDDGRHWKVTFTALGETALPTRIVGDTVYKALGTRYRVDVTRG